MAPGISDPIQARSCGRDTGFQCACMKQSGENLRSPVGLEGKMIWRDGAAKEIIPCIRMDIQKWAKGLLCES